MGFAATLKSYGYSEQNLNETELVAASHVEFLQDLKWFVETDDMVFSHAGIDPEEPNLRTFTTAITSHPTLFTYTGPFEKRIVCGHYIQQDFQPLMTSVLTCLDTGAGLGGPLTLANVKTRDALQF
jgi:hypothetical protein